jgi:hypothetical protein
MHLLVQVVSENVSGFQDSTTTNGRHVVQTRTSDQKITAVTTVGMIIVCTSAWWKSTAESVALFTAVADVLLVKIQRRKMKSTLLYLLFLWLSALCSYLRYCTVK